MKRSPFSLGMAVSVSLLAGACSTTPQSAATPTSKRPTPTESPSVTLFYEGNAQFELISPQGIRVLVDVYDPSQLTSPVTAQDILLTTHGHSDHYNKSFVDSFPGQKLTMQEGTIRLSGIGIRGIASAHNEGDPFLPENGTDYIFVIDMGGIRIVHFGDIGQNALTPDQLSSIGKVNLALTQLANSYSSMTAENKKGFNLMDQVHPGLIIPTHIDMDAAMVAAQKWPGFIHQGPLVLKVSDSQDSTRIIFMGQTAPSWKISLNLTDW